MRNMVEPIGGDKILIKGILKLINIKIYSAKLKDGSHRNVEAWIYKEKKLKK